VTPSDAQALTDARWLYGTIKTANNEVLRARLKGLPTLGLEEQRRKLVERFNALPRFARRAAEQSDLDAAREIVREHPACKFEDEDRLMRFVVERCSP
jgi:hypothetical protein